MTQANIKSFSDGRVDIWFTGAATPPAGDTRLAYQGKSEGITGLTTITPKINCFQHTLNHYAGLQVSGKLTTANTGDRFYENLQYDWDFGDPGGTETFTDWRTGLTVNANDSQQGPDARYVYKSTGTYTVTLTVSGKDENGTLITASTTTLLRVGEYEMFMGGATGGTYTITVDGQTTAAIAYNADLPTIVAAVELLSTVGAGNCVDSGYGKFWLTNDVAGDTMTVTENISGLTGVGIGDAAPKLIPRYPSSSAAVCTVNSISGWTKKYYDSAASPGGDGTELTPYNLESELRTNIDYDLSGISNQISYLKRGSDFTLTDQITIGHKQHNQRILPYGTGATPILQAASGRDIINTDFWYNGTGDNDLSSTNYQLEDIAIVGISFISDAGVVSPEDGKPMVNPKPSLNGNSANPLTNMSGFTIADCDFTRTGGFGQCIKATGPERFSGLCIWNTNTDMGGFLGLANISGGISSWGDITGGKQQGMSAVSGLEHNVYLTIHKHSSYRYTDYGPNVSAGYSINGNAADSEVSTEFVTIDGNNITGASNGIDFSNVNNDYTSGNLGHFDNVVVQNNKIYSSSGAILCANLHKITFRHNWSWDMDFMHLKSDDDANTQWQVYGNHLYGDVPLIRTNHDSIYLRDNYIHVVTTQPLIDYNNDKCDLTTCDFGGNTYYGPLSTNFYANGGAGPPGTFTGWKALTGTPDTDSTDTEFSFVDGPNGDLRLS